MVNLQEKISEKLCFLSRNHIASLCRLDQPHHTADAAACREKDFYLEIIFKLLTMLYHIMLLITATQLQLDMQREQIPAPFRCL